MWGGGFGIPATGQPDSVRPDTDRPDTARVTQGDASASDHPEDGLLGNETGWAEMHMEGGGCLEMKTETIRKRPVMRSRLMPERLKQDQGRRTGRGRRGRFFCFRRPAWTRKAVRVCFAGSAGILLSANLGVGLLKGRRGESGGEAFSEEMEAERVAGRCVRVLAA